MKHVCNYLGNSDDHPSNQNPWLSGKWCQIWSSLPPRKAASQLTKIPDWESGNPMGNTTLVESPTHCFCCQAIRGETFGYIWGAKLCQAAVGCPPGWFAVCKHASTVSFSKKFLEWIQLTVDVDGEDGAWSVPLRTMDLWVSNVASLFLIPWIFFMENSMEFPGKFRKWPAIWAEIREILPVWAGGVDSGHGCFHGSWAMPSGTWVRNT